MNEIMMPFAVCKNFTFPGIERSRVQIPKEPMQTVDMNNSMDSSTSHFREMSDSLRKNPGVDVSMSNSDSISEILDIPGNVSDNSQLQVAERSRTDKDKSCAKYKTVSVNIENISETTVINTSFNIISQSAVRDIGKKGFIFNSVKSPIIVSDPFDKSRVVVQVLTSNAKSRTVIENQARPETPHVSSFRDDVCKMLSKADPSDHDNESNSVDMSEEVNCTSVKQSSEEAKLKHDNTNNIRSRRKRNLKFFFLNGRGIKFSDIEYVASNLRNAQPRLLRILHYLLFDTYGSCSTGLKLSQTMRNILHFCGYPFSRDSEEFQRKRTCLLRLPLPILYEIHKAIIGNNCKERSDMVAELVEFLMDPQDFKAPSSKLGKNAKDLSAEEYTKLMNIATTKPLPTVLLKKLNDNEIDQLQNQIKSDCRDNKIGLASDYQPPIYILNGPGRKLKSFPKIMNHVQAAKRRMIEILHFILYGRMEHVDVCRRNILEFSGFLPCQKDFINQTRSTLTKLGRIELSQLCRILCLQAKTNTRIRKIEKIMKYLSAPSEPKKRRGVERAKKVDHSIASCIQRNKEDNYERSEVRGLEKTTEGNHSVSTVLNDSKSNFTEMKESATGPKLRDFSKICSNVECAAPSDLLELNDLLFIKPSDESVIHQEILDFTRFRFSLNSMEYHYRKTLMHYMGFCVTRKIAQLLDIENWEKASSQEELSCSILNFLMEMKLPACPFPNMVPPKSVVENNFWKKANSLKEGNKKAESVKEGNKKADSVKEGNKKADCVKEGNKKADSVKENNKKTDSVKEVNKKADSVKENNKKADSVTEDNRKAESVKKDNRKAEFQKETVTSEYFQFYKEETEKSWSFLNGAKPTENASSPAPPHSSETRGKNSHDMNQIVRKCRKVFIHRLSKASEQSNNLTEKKHGPLANVWSLPDDSTPLCALIHHPSDEELKQIICEIIKNDLWDITMGDLVKKVYRCYPKINLHYREDFIKAEARQILAQMRSNAVNTLNNLLIMPSS